MNFMELHSIITRVGENCKIIFCGDIGQRDLGNSGLFDFMKILKGMRSFINVEFGIEDIVRSGMVREYIIKKLELGL
jgi:phosphate starvation-inducible protein PhoH and related proteins